MTRTRVDVWTVTRDEGDWPDVLRAYERAVGLLQIDPPNTRPSTPTDWRFLAAMHGIGRLLPGSPPLPDFVRPDLSNDMWCMCQHESWFFFPWHRMYLLALEKIIQDVLGDDDWSLPYWVAINPDDPSTAVLPPAFRDATPGNHLRTPLRSGPANGGLPIGQPDTLDQLSASMLDALDAALFSTADGISTFGGGERADPSFSGNEELGLMEGLPHGTVHVLVGGRSSALPTQRGLMGSPYTAALDPIFWLHHANIDRLWETWLHDERRTHRNPPDGAWLGTEFTFPAPRGQTVTWRIADVLDIDELGYRYESIAPPDALLDGGVARPGITVTPREEDVVSDFPPDVVGVAADVAVSGGAEVEIDIAVPEPEAGIAPDVDAASSRMYLRVEGVTGHPTAAYYNVYVNVPDGEEPASHPELRIGALSTFGMAEASQVDDLHDGGGLSSVFDITAVREAQRSAGRWDSARVRVTFRPVELAAGDDDAAAADTGTSDDVRAARVAVLTTR